MSDLKYEVENLQQTLNEKLSLNKKLYNDNNTLYKTLENKNIEIDDLLNRIAELEEKADRLVQDNSNMEKNIFSLQETKGSQKIRIENLQMDLDRFKRISDENERLIKRQDAEKLDLLGKLDESRFELKNLLGKLKAKEENLSYTQRQMDEANKTVINLQNNLSELEQQFTRAKLDLNSLNASLHKERSLRLDSEKSNDSLQSYLKDKNLEVKQLSIDLDTLRIQNERLSMEKIKLLGEIDLYKNHLITLSEANDKVNNYQL